MKNDEKLLRQFGITEGVRNGSTMAINILIGSMIANTAGFGKNGLVLTSGLTFALSALVELPIAYWADHFGWRKSTFISLSIRFFYALSLTLAAISAIQNSLTLFYIFVVLYSLILALSNAFLRGSYQAAYLDWYKQLKTDKDRKVHLFIDSFKYSIAPRIFIPIVAFIFNFLLIKILGYFSIFEEYRLIASNSLTILILQSATLSRVLNDYKSANLIPESGKRTDLVSVKSLFIAASSSFPELSVYAYAWMVRNFVFAVLIAKVYPLLTEVGISLEYIWGGGALIALFIFYSQTLLAKSFLRFVKSFSTVENIRKISTFGISLASLVGFVLFYCDIHVYSKILYLIFFCLLSLTFADSARMEIESNIGHIIKNNFKASWMGAGNLLSYIGYAFISGAVLILNLSGYDINIIWGLFALFGLAISLQFVQKKSPSQQVD